MCFKERNIAIKEKNEAWIQLSETKGELIQTNQQLLEVRAVVTIHRSGMNNSSCR